MYIVYVYVPYMYHIYHRYIVLYLRNAIFRCVASIITTIIIHDTLAYGTQTISLSFTCSAHACCNTMQLGRMYIHRAARGSRLAAACVCILHEQCAMRGHRIWRAPGTPLRVYIIQTLGAAIHIRAARYITNNMCTHTTHTP